MCELTVILKTSESTFKQKFLIHDTFTLSHDDPTIIACIKEAKDNFNCDPEEIQIKIHMEIL